MNNMSSIRSLCAFFVFLAASTGFANSWKVDECSLVFSNMVYDWEEMVPWRIDITISYEGSDIPSNTTIEFCLLEKDGTQEDCVRFGISQAGITVFSSNVVTNVMTFTLSELFTPSQWHGPFGGDTDICFYVKGAIRESTSIPWEYDSLRQVFYSPIIYPVFLGQGTYLYPVPAGYHPKNDFDGNGKSDAGVFFAEYGHWAFSHEQSAGCWGGYFGGGIGVLPITGDFNGDGLCDFGTYYPPTGWWRIKMSEPCLYFTPSGVGEWETHFGFEGTIPITGDFDGDEVMDFGCYYPPWGAWYIFKSSIQNLWSTCFGYEGTIPITGDFDGDGVDDFGCYYPPSGSWYIYKSRDGFWSTQFGYSGTLPVVGDFDGDQIDDFGCSHPANGWWYFFESRTLSMRVVQKLIPNAVPVTGDYDGDTICDFGLYDASAGRWTLFISSLLQWKEAGSAREYTPLGGIITE